MSSYIIRVRCRYNEGFIALNDNFIVTMNKKDFSYSELQDKVTASYEGVDGMSNIKIMAISAIIEDK